MGDEKFLLKMVVNNTKGVMARIATLLARKGYNISSICVGKHMEPSEAGIILAIHGSEMEVEQARKMLEKLVNVISVESYHKSDAIERELCLVKVRKAADLEDRLKGYNARVLASGKDFDIIEVADYPQRVEEFIQMAMKDIGVIDLSRSGHNAMQSNTRK